MSKFCIVPWTQLEIGPLGDIRPCCEYKGYYGNINNTSNSLVEMWNGENFRKLRTDYLNGYEPSGCRKCFHQEQAGLQSRRLQENRMFSHFINEELTDIAISPILIDFKFGNICNIKCRICSSINSHQWRDEEKKIFGFSIDRDKDQVWIESEERWKELENFIDYLEVIYISGGEPLLIEKNFEFLELCVDRNRSKNIRVRIVTNGTVSIKKKYIDILEKFKHVTIMYSIDDIHERFEYQRNPAKWNKVERNFIDAMQHEFLDLKIVYTVSIFNVLSASKFVDWCKKINFSVDKIYANFLRDPNYFDISMLSKEQKNLIKLKLKNSALENQIRQYLDTSFTDFLQESIIKQRNSIIKNIDQIRGENFSILFPEVDSILKIHND